MNCVSGGTWVFEFQVKFYPPDPQSLKEDITRWVGVNTSVRFAGCKLGLEKIFAAVQWFKETKITSLPIDVDPLISANH